MPADQKANSTQQHLPIAGIEEGVIIMTDGSVRAVLKVEPINFELKSESEQDGIIYSYQAFLNSLEFPIQIVIQSKKLDLERYLIKLESTLGNITNELLRIQTEDYIGFVRRLISVANIMSKRFYVIVKYAALEKPAGIGGFLHKTPTGPLMDQDQFERYRTEVYNRANSVGGGLARIGMRVSVMDTQQLIELFYGTYNPDIATEERLSDLEAVTANVISGPMAAAANPEIAATPAPAAQSPVQPAQAPTQAPPA